MNMSFKPFKFFLKEGGNIKVKGVGGQEVGASPFKPTPKVRENLQKDLPAALHQLHHSFHQATGEHLFGPHGKAINNKSMYVGSTRQFMDNSIGHDEFHRHKKEVGDFDMLVPSEHKDALYDHAKEGSKFGKFTVVGRKRHGTETSLLMRHEDTGHIHQMDFVASKYEHGEPTEGERFAKSSDWEDTKKGIKGAHHKILLNSVGLNRYKFSVANGLTSRTDESEKSTKEPHEVAHRLFGNEADVDKIHSFHGVSDLIKRHVPKQQHQEIYDKFKNSLKSVKADHTSALDHLRKTLGVKDTVSEQVSPEEKEHHVHVTYMGASPITHQGHYEDIGGSMMRARKGKMIVGLSGKTKLYTDKQREQIGERQWGGNAKFRVSPSAGETVAHAFHSLPKTGKKILHLHFGHDRRKDTERLKQVLESGGIREMNGEQFDAIHIHYPPDENRSHGFSGTAMRTAAKNGDIEEFHRHLGSNFTRAEAKEHMNKFRRGLASGEIVIKRK